MMNASKLRFLLPLAAGIGGVVATADAAQRGPNVLLILTDDQGWGDVRANGNPLISTPNMDRLHDRGVVMDHFYVSPLSAPTRASILTGRYHLRTGVSSVQSGFENMRPGETTIAELFLEAGYRTGCFGKWHNGAYFPYSPNGQGFEEFTGFCCGHWCNYFDPPLQHNETTFRGRGYITDIITDAALDFIGKNRSRPFFCYVPYNAPHSPFMVPDKYYDKYKDIEARNDKDRAILASIYGMVECVDDNIGRLLTRLDELGLTENTIVIFMTDNGPVHVVRYNGGMRGAKGTVHEGGVRVPCFISWPGTLQHRVVEQPAAHIDLLPTLMELCGIEGYMTAFPVDGISLAPALLGGGIPPAGRYIYTHRKAGEMHPWLGAVRTDSLRLEVFERETWLFNVVRDPAETTNIFNAADPAHESLLARYMAWYADASQGVALDTNIPVGYAQAPEVRVATPEGHTHGALKCYGFPNQNWVRHFRTPADSLCLTLDVVREGTYEIMIEYNHLTDNPASRAVAVCAGKVLSAPVPAFVPVRLSAPPRADMGEAPEMSWARLSLGRVKLGKGLHGLTLYATGIPDSKTMEVKTVIINRK